MSRLLASREDTYAPRLLPSDGIPELDPGLDLIDVPSHGSSALHRYREQGMEKSPGEDVRYIVVDDNARLKDRVRLHFEQVEGFDAEFYATEMIRACESIVSPLGWGREDIRRYLRNHREGG